MTNDTPNRSQTGRSSVACFKPIPIDIYHVINFEPSVFGLKKLRKIQDEFYLLFELEIRMW